MALLVQNHIFGLNGIVPHALHHIDDQHLLYPAGSSLVLYNIEQKSQRFIALAEGGNITAVTATPRLIAVAERSEKRVAVSIYDSHTLKRKKVIKDDELQFGKEVVSLSFSNDGKFLLTQSSDPDWLLQLWNWEKGKVYASIKLNYAPNVKVSQVSFNPFDKTVPQLCVVGANIFRIYRFTEGTLKPLTFQKTDHRNNIAHTWLSAERIAVSTDEGKVLIYENAELRIELTANLQQDGSNKPHMLTTIRAGTNGFVAGSNNGMLQEWDRTDDSNLYRCVREVKLENSVIRGLCVSSNEDTAFCAFDNNQLIMASSLQSDDVKVEKIAQAHHSAVTGLDVCVRKPLMATCGSDQSVRVWNFGENTMEIVKFFKSEPYSIAFHPSGLFLLVGFAEGVKLLKILLDDIRPYWELGARGVKECRFSNGGQFFAMAHDNMVIVRSTWSFEVTVALKGHLSKVRTLAWAPDDSTILTVASDGVVMEWDVRTGKRIAEYTHPSLFQTAIYGQGATGGGGGANSSGGGNAIFLGTGDGRIVELRDGQVSREVSAHSQVGQLAIGRSGRTLVAATASGHIRAMRLPFAPGLSVTPGGASITAAGGASGSNRSTGGAGAGTVSGAPSATAGSTSTSEDQAVLHMHNVSVSRLRISFDEQYVLSAASDGCLCIMRLNQRDSTRATATAGAAAAVAAATSSVAPGKRDARDATYSDEILALRSDVKDQLRVMTDLRVRVEEIRVENERVLEQRDLAYTQKARETTERFSHDIEALAAENDVLRVAYEETVAENSSQLTKLKDRHHKEREEIEASTRFKLQAEEERFTALEVALDVKKTRWSNQMQLIQASLNDELEALRDFYSKKIQEKEFEINQLQVDMIARRNDFSVKETDIDVATNQEVLQIQFYYEQRLKDERQTLKQIQTENEEMHKKYDSLVKKIEANKIELQKMAVEERRLQSIIKTFEKEISGARRELQERDDTIEDKEKRISDLKKKNKELEKFKFVLDYKIVELRKQIEPREQDIVRLQGQLNDMGLELGEYVHSRNTMLFARDDLVQKVAGTERELEVQRKRTAEIKLVVDAIRRDTVVIAQHVREPNELKRAVRQYFQKYCGLPDEPEAVLSSFQPGSSDRSAPGPDGSFTPSQLRRRESAAAAAAAASGGTSSAGSDGSSSSSSRRGRAGAFANEREQSLRQRDLLEKTLLTVQRKLSKQMVAREAETSKLVDENVQLTSEVNALRRELKISQQSVVVEPSRGTPPTVRGVAHV
ncbi:hypothetical protein BC828DRAFT_390267 [Blastocladiella britannica]|nr:hypothetical protein BC828DRAFT_390267 [Blastocladiella britannica]